MKVREYLILPNRRQGGVTLSLRESWGNIPYGNVEDARAAAREDAGREPYTIKREQC